jgi:acyl-CoA synthetase (AMP-forming)/AMP-acid ligase II
VQSLLDWLADPSADTGLHIAAASDEWSYTSYEELAAEVRRFSAVLLESDPAPGAIVSLMLTRSKCFIVAFMAVLAAGLTPSPVAPLSSFRRRSRYEAHLTEIFTVAEPALIVAQEDTRDMARDVVRGLGSKTAVIPAPAEAAEPVEPVELAKRPAGTRLAAIGRRAPEDTALLQFTSGSSGSPKGVRVSWRALTANVQAICEWLEWRPGDVFASWLPLFHDMGLVGGMIFPVTTGTDLWIMTPEQFVRSPKRWLDCFGRHGATITTAPNFGYAYCVKRVKPEELEGSDFSAWRVAISGAERIDPVTLADFAALLRPHGFDSAALIGAYGLAESTLAVTGVHPGRRSPVLRYSPGDLDLGRWVEPADMGVLGEDRVEDDWIVGCGAPVGDLSVQIVDEDGKPLPDGFFGEIVVKGSSLADGYVHADGTLSTFGVGGLHTGDGGFRWENQLYVVGRLADSLKVRGTAIFAEDLEAQLATIPGLGAGRLVVLLGQIGGRGHAVLLVEDSAHEAWFDEAMAMLGARLTAETSVSVLLGRRGSIERTSSGKPRRRVLWKALLGGPDGASDGVANGWRLIHGPASRGRAKGEAR